MHWNWIRQAVVFILMVIKGKVGQCFNSVYTHRGITCIFDSLNVSLIMRTIWTKQIMVKICAAVGYLSYAVVPLTTTE